MGQREALDQLIGMMLREDCEFKLHAPYNTTLEGVIKAGKLEELKVTPESRAKDVVNMFEN